MTNKNTIKIISISAAFLVGMLAILAFILSYSSLQHMAAQNGVGAYLSYLWPLLLDFAMIVFSLAILRANLRQESAKYPWLLTIVFASLATLGNILDVSAMAQVLGIPQIVIAASVKALAPLALVLSFELLMSMSKAEIKRSSIVQSLTELNTELNNGRLESKTLVQEIEQKRSMFVQLSDEIEELRRSKNGLEIVQYDVLNTHNEQRLNEKHEKLNVLLNYYRTNPNATLEQAGEFIERSKGTVSNYLNELEQAGLIHRNGEGVKVIG
jgi:hypothetical protein